MRAVAKPVADCGICGARAALWGVVDFHKSCIEAKGKRLPLSGVPVYYHRCSRCGFVFADGFRNWSPADFQRWIYNRDYGVVDPDYSDVRPSANATAIERMFGAHKSAIRLLDYGGGNGSLAGRLRRNGYQAETFDPFSEHHRRPVGKVNLVTAFEVFEHCPRPLETLDDLLSFLDEDGVVLFSTLVQPADFARIGLSWWYVGPRNGHVSIHSRRSLAALFGVRGFTVGSFSDNLHLAYRRLPAIAAHLVSGGRRMPEGTP